MDRRVLIALLLLAGCATVPVETWNRCNTGRVIDACSVDDYPPLMLAPWPFPRLLVPIEVAEAMAAAPPPQEGSTPGGGLLKKLGK